MWSLLFLIVLYMYQEALKLPISLNQPKVEENEGDGAASSRIQIEP